MIRGEKPSVRLGGVDAVLVALALGACVAFLGVHQIMGGAFARMFADFGSALPTITTVALSLPFGLGVGAASVALAAAGTVWRLRSPSPAGRALLSLAILIPAAAVAVFLVAAYLPIMALADGIQ